MRNCEGYEDEELTGMSSEGDNRRRCKAFVHLIRSYQLRSLHSAHERHRHIHLTSRMSAPPMSKRREAYQDNVKRLNLSYPPFESIDRQTAVFGNLNGMAILLKYLDGQLLIDQVVFSEQDIERDVVGRRDWADSVGLQCGYEGRTQILRGYWSSDLRGNTVVQAPFHWKIYYV